MVSALAFGLGRLGLSPSGEHCVICVEKYSAVPGLKVKFLVHLQSFASKIFSTSKLVRPLVNSFQMFERHG